MEGESVKQSKFWGPPGLSGMAFLALFMLVLFGQSLGNVFNVLFDSDSCWLIQTGLWMLKHQALPSTNPFSGGDAVLGQIPIVCYQWLFELSLGIFYQTLGLQGVALYVAACFGITYAVLVLWLYGRGFKAMPDILVCILFSLLALKSYALARPPLITLMFTAVLLWLCSLNLSKKQAWLIFPLLFVTWANMHLGFIAGLVIFGLYSVDQSCMQKNGQPLYVWLTCIVSSLVNPYGARLYTYFLQLADSPFMNHNIFELGSPRFNEQPLFLVYFLITLLVGLSSIRDARLRKYERAFFVLSFGLALYSMRHIFLLVLATLPMMAMAIQSLRFRIGSLVPAWLTAFSFNSFTADKEKPWPWVIGFILLGAVLAQQKAYTVYFPHEANLAGTIQYLNKHPLEGPLLSNEIWGSYLIFFSKERSYLDSRMDMYGDAWVQSQYNAMKLEANWKELFRKYRFRYALLPSKSLQASYLTDCCRGIVLYRDDYAMLIELRPEQDVCLSGTG